ncbi:energy transducer TonB [Selenomonas massiliensis]|uniref:energy transducer TonB n=1 Tax=Selenomonas massiliensis TaxID=2058293 RepID=UPI000D0F8544|nr:TonB family protein [Selenomonas massiliensis]
MDEDVMERDGERKALGASLLLHLTLFLTAAAMGLFSVANPPGKRPPIDVVLYDAGSDAGSSAVGDSAPAAAPVVTVDDIVVQDKNTVQQEEREQERKPQMNTSRPTQGPVRATQTGTAGNASGQGSGTGSGTVGVGSGTSAGNSDGTAGLGAAPAPPQERVEASLRVEARPEYPQELIDDDVEGSVTIKILVAADGSVEAVDVASSSGYRAMDRAAVAAGWQFQFNPGDNGRRGVWTKTFRFQLN